MFEQESSLKRSTFFESSRYVYKRKETHTHTHTHTHTERERERRLWLFVLFINCLYIKSYLE